MLGAQRRSLPNKASNGKNGGRSAPLSAELRDALQELQILAMGRESTDRVLSVRGRDAGLRLRMVSCPRRKSLGHSCGDRFDGRKRPGPVLPS
jgi:hypothetical protein